jgi:hypothetical protein
MLEDDGSSWGKRGRWWYFIGGKEEENEGKTACD